MTFFNSFIKENVIIFGEWESWAILVRKIIILLQPLLILCWWVLDLRFNYWLASFNFHCAWKKPYFIKRQFSSISLTETNLFITNFFGIYNWKLWISVSLIKLDDQNEFIPYFLFWYLQVKIMHIYFAYKTRCR